MTTESGIGNGIKPIDMLETWIICLSNGLWRSVKYEEVYLHAYDSVSQARSRIGRYFKFYNNDRKYQTLCETP